MRRKHYALLLPSLVVLALGVAAPAAADAPTRETSILTLGPFVDDELCAFPLTTTVERTRTTITFADGDVQRHVSLLVTTTANGKTLLDRDAYTVFIDAGDPDAWVITGSFVHSRLIGGGTLALQSGLLVYDVQADQVLDPHLGPHPTTPDVCAALS